MTDATTIETGCPTASWRTIWRRLLESAGSNAQALRRSMIGLAVAALGQGLAYA